MKIATQVFPSVEKEYYEQMIWIDKAGGTRIVEKGKEYLDAISGLWNKNLGYGVEQINNCLLGQLNVCEYINPWISTTRINQEYADRLLHFAGFSQGSCYLSSSGSESIEIAIKAARKYQCLQGNLAKKIILTFDNSYHGSTVGAWSISGVERRLTGDYGPLMNGVAYTPIIKDEKTFDKFLHYIKEYANKTAAFILEPTLGYGGGHRISKEYMQRIKEVCTTHDILLIFDEVTTGFHRTGKRFAFLEYQFTPDILCLSKGINNGVLPLGATLFDKKIFELLTGMDHFAHFSTQNFNPLLSASGLATLEIYEKKDNNFEENINQLSAFFKERIQQRLAPYITRNFTHGLFITLEFKHIQSETNIRDMFFELKERGVLTYIYSNQYGTGLILAPMYITTLEEADRIIETIQYVAESRR